jgi:hypothetical protein
MRRLTYRIKLFLEYANECVCNAGRKFKSHDDKKKKLNDDDDEKRVSFSFLCSIRKVPTPACLHSRKMRKKMNRISNTTFFVLCLISI